MRVVNSNCRLEFFASTKYDEIISDFVFYIASEVKRQKRFVYLEIKN